MVNMSWPATVIRALVVGEVKEAGPDALRQASTVTTDQAGHFKGSHRFQPGVEKCQGHTGADAQRHDEVDGQPYGSFRR